MNKLIFAFVLLISFAGCKDEKPTNAPTVVLDSIFTAMKDGNFEEMKKYITKADVAMIDAAEKFLTAADPESVPKIKAKVIEKIKEQGKNVQYKLQNEKIDGNHATVEAEITTKDTASQDGKKVSKHTFELVKEDNAWKIALSKPANQMFNSMKGNMGNRDAGLKEGFDKMQKMDKDTLKMLIREGAKYLDSADRKKKQSIAFNQQNIF